MAMRAANQVRVSQAALLLRHSFQLMTPAMLCDADSTQGQQQRTCYAVKNSFTELTQAALLFRHSFQLITPAGQHS